MSFEISFHLRFHVIGDLTVWSVVGFSLFRALRPISGGMEGRLSPFDGLLRAPYGANNNSVLRKGSKRISLSISGSQ